MRTLLACVLALVLSAPSIAYGATNDAAAPAQDAVSQSELQEMREMLKAQAKLLEEQRAALEAEQKRIRELEQRLGPAKPELIEAVGKAPAPIAAVAPAIEPTKAEEAPAPLYFRIGSARFTPGGFLDLDTVGRSTAVGSGTPTAFGAIPYSNTAQGQLSEIRFSAQTSRIGLKLDSKVAGSDVLGYVEADFTGNQPGSQYVTSNSNTLRMRMYLVDVRRNRWEVMGGQAWTMMTPARKGLGLMPGDLFIGQLADANYLVGLLWARQAQFRVMYHATDKTVLGVSIENPQQYVGGAVVYPSAYSTALGTQFDAGTGTATPNLHPDFIFKIAHDRKIAGHGWHIEGAGLVRSFRDYRPVVAGIDLPAATSTATGGGISINTIFELFKNFNLIGNSFWSDGGGRYIAASGPDAVVHPDGSISLVHSGALLGGFEWAATPTVSLVGYYGGDYFQKNSFVDTTNTAAGTHYAGFGFQGSSSSANRTIQEASLGMIRTFWKNPNYGALQVVTQMSYVTRAPWYVATGAPKNAHTTMGFVSFRYIIP
jgi:hypothetical protein